MASLQLIPRPQSLAELVAQRVETAIIEGEFRLGEKISEERLVAAFGVSRSPARDALNMLQFAGLVEVRSRRGTFVFHPSEDDVLALCDYRFLLEREAALMARRRDPGRLNDRLSQVICDMSQAAERGDNRAFGHADTAFHNTFFELCGNPLVAEAYDLAKARIATLRTLLTAPFRDRRSAGLAQHRRMAELLICGRDQEFSDLLREHADWAGRLPDALLAPEKECET